MFRSYVACRLDYCQSYGELKHFFFFFFFYLWFFSHDRKLSRGVGIIANRTLDSWQPSQQFGVTIEWIAEHHQVSRGGFNSGRCIWSIGDRHISNFILMPLMIHPSICSIVSVHHLILRSFFVIMYVIFSML